MHTPLRYKTDEECEKFTTAESCPVDCAWGIPDGGATPAAPWELGQEGGGGPAGCGALGMSSKAYARARRVVMGGPRGGRLPAALKAPVAAGNFSRLFREPWLPGTHEHSGTTHLRCVHARARTHTDRHRYTNNTHRDSLSLSLSLSLTRARAHTRTHTHTVWWMGRATWSH